MQPTYQPVLTNDLLSPSVPLSSVTSSSNAVFSNPITTIKTFSKDLKPVSDFLDYKRLSRPNSLDVIQQRTSLNIKYFRANYLLIVFIFSLYALLTSPWLLGVIVFLGAIYYWIARQPGTSLTIQNKNFTKSQLYMYLGLLSIPLLWWTAAAATVFWVAAFSGSLVGVHASCMDAPVQHSFGGV